jgi:ribosomal protein S18 acetylase RimI-like enzyme
MSKFLSIRPFTKADFADIISIANNRFGNNYIVLEELHSYLNINNKIGIVATVNNQIAGFALAQICNLDELIKLILSEHNWLKKQFSNYHTIGILKTIAVDPKFSNLGIGTALTKYRVDVLNKKCDIILAISWEHKLDASNTKLLEKCRLSLKPNMRGSAL